MQKKDHYAILGVSRTATQAEIKSAYKKLAFQYHPDRNPGNKAAAAKFGEVSGAFQVLGDPVKREEYDQGRSAGVCDPHQTAGECWQSWLA